MSVADKIAALIQVTVEELVKEDDEKAEANAVAQRQEERAEKFAADVRKLLGEESPENSGERTLWLRAVRRLNEDLPPHLDDLDKAILRKLEDSWSAD